MMLHTLLGSNQDSDGIAATVAVPQAGSWARRMFAFAGPGYIVAVGYMDPGNWATSVAAGSAYGYRLLVWVLLSSLLAMLLQALAARLGLVTGRDLPQLCRQSFGKPVSVFLWVTAEIAIIATDLAELIGTAVALELLFGIPLVYGVVLTGIDALLLLLLQNRGMRWLEAFIVVLIATITVCFGFEMAWSRPEIAAMLQGFVPHADMISNPQALYLGIGILGATVMPHNIYLHTALVQSRRIGRSEGEVREAIGFAQLDSNLALLLAFFINCAILILAAAAFYVKGNTTVAEIQDAYRLLAPALGYGGASVLFAVALLLCGLNSSVTATLAGQVVMEGFIQWRLRPVLRRLVTRGLAIVPAVIVTAIYGESGTANLLVLSQVLLSIQLPFAVVPLMLFSSKKGLMGPHRPPLWMLALGWAGTVAIVIINGKLLFDALSG